VQQADTKVAELAAQKAAAQKKLDEARAKVDGTLAHVKHERDSLRAQRSERTAGIPPETLEVYERGRKSRGDALATVEGEYCSGCGERQTRNDLYAVENRTRIVTCKGCNRILIAG
jgi:predicted  nucleic acid-binding Zn-ribbon protein